MSVECKEKTTLVSKFDIYNFEVVPSGLINAPYTFQRLLDHVLRELDFVLC